MRVRLDVIEVDDEFRRRLNIYEDRPGLATYAEVKLWFEQAAESLNDDLYADTQETYEIELVQYEPVKREKGNA